MRARTWSREPPRRLRIAVGLAGKAREDGAVALDPAFGVEAPGPAPGGLGTLAEALRKLERGLGEVRRRGRMVTLPVERGGDSQACVVPDELRDAAARGVDDGQPAGHGLEH